MIFLSIIIPVFNESARIEGSLSDIKEFMDSQEYEYEVIIPDDGSTDNSVELIEQCKKNWQELSILKLKHKGKGPALIAGINKANGKYLYLCDSDLSVSIDQLPKMLTWLIDQGFDIAIATREGTGASRVGEPYMRHFMGRVFNIIVQLLVLRGINDTQCGFKVFKTSAAQEIFKHTKLYSINDPVIEGSRLGAYDVEMLLVARKLDYQIKEVPVTWVYGEDSKVHKLNDSYYNFMDVLNIRKNSLNGLYET